MVNTGFFMPRTGGPRGSERGVEGVYWKVLGLFSHVFVMSEIQNSAIAF